MDLPCARIDPGLRGGSQRPDRPAITIVIPCLNEEAVLHVTHSRLAHCAAEEFDWTFLFVDDGSTDGTWEALTELQARDPRVRRMRLSRNFGHQRALTAGIDHAQGDAVVAIDADLQDPPELIGEFVDWWKAGFDIVYGRRTKRHGESFLRLRLTGAFYFLANLATAIRLEPEVGDFYLLDRRVVDELRRWREHDRFVRGIVQWLGFPKRAIEYERQARPAGRSKYGWSKLCGLAADCLFAFARNPFPAMLVLTALWTCGAACAAVFLLVGSLSALPIVLASLCGGQAFCLLSLGLLGQFVWRTFQEVKGRPMYVIEHLDPPVDDDRSNSAVACSAWIARANSLRGSLVPSDNE